MTSRQQMCLAPMVRLRRVGAPDPSLTPGSCPCGYHRPCGRRDKGLRRPFTLGRHTLVRVKQRLFEHWEKSDDTRLRPIADHVGLCGAWRGAVGATVLAQNNAAPAEASKIAEEAFVYGFPLVMNYARLLRLFRSTRRRSIQGALPIRSTIRRASTRLRTPPSLRPTATRPILYVAMDLRAEPFRDLQSRH